VGRCCQGAPATARRAATPRPSPQRIRPWPPSPKRIAVAALLDGSARLEGGRFAGHDQAAFRARTIHDWPGRRRSRRTCHGRGGALADLGGEPGARRPSASIQDLYTARGRGEVAGFTVPASTPGADLRHGRTISPRTGKGSGPVILELARSEQTTRSSVCSSTCRTSSPGIAAGWRGPCSSGRPLPVQRQEVRPRPGGVTEEIRKGCRDASRPGTATSTWTAPRWSTCRSPPWMPSRKVNYTRAAEITA